MKTDRGENVLFEINRSYIKITNVVNISQLFINDLLVCSTQYII